MSHETLIYGFIEGSGYTAEEYRLLQRRNIAVLKRLPLEFDEYPGICRDMFSWPPQYAMRGGWRAQVIHFGGSFKNIDMGYSDIATWIEKFERLLARLYWLQAIAHLHTEIMGELAFAYQVSDEVIETYRARKPAPSSKWKRQFFNNTNAEEFIP